MFISCSVTICSSHGAMLPPPGQPAEESSWSLNYVTGSLFSCPEDESLAHCISEDCRMGAGIAVMFKKEFKGVEELKEQSESALFIKNSLGVNMSYFWWYRFPGDHFVQHRETWFCFLQKSNKSHTFFSWKIILFCTISHIFCIN